MSLMSLLDTNNDNRGAAVDKKRLLFMVVLRFKKERKRKTKMSDITMSIFGLCDDDDDGQAPAEIEVDHLSAFQFFGESALLASASDDELPQRTATVRVSSDKLELLCLHRSNYLRLMKSTVAQNMFQSKRDSVTSVEGGDGGEMCSESASVLERLKSVSDQRISENKLVMERLQRESSKKKIVPLGRPKTDVVVVSSELPIENDFSLSSRGDQDMGMV